MHYDLLVLWGFFRVFQRFYWNTQHQKDTFFELVLRFSRKCFLCFICLYFQDFSTISNARKLGKVLKWSQSSALEHIKARIFVFNLVPYEKIEFSKKLTSSFFKNLFKKKFFFFSKNRLWYVVATSVLDILTLSRGRYH